MKYITTKEAAKKWNMSPRRVSGACKAGKVNGAVLFGKNWQIPENAPKPIDRRTKDFAAEEDAVDRVYLYFNPTYCKKSKSFPIGPFDQEYCDILDTQLRGDLKEAKKKLKSFIKKCDPDYLFIANSLLLITCIETGSKLEIAIIRESIRQLLNAEKYPYSAAFTKLSIYESVDLTELTIPEEMQPLFFYLNTRCDILKKIIRGANANLPDMGIYELSAQYIDNADVPVISIYMHCLLALVYALFGEERKSIIHKEAAAKYALEHEWYTPLAGYAFVLDWSFIKEIDEEKYQEINALSEKIINIQIKMGVYSRIFGSYKTRDANAAKAMFLVAKGHTINEIADILNTSLYNVNKYIEKAKSVTGLETHEEMAHFIRHSIDFI